VRRPAAEQPAIREDRAGLDGKSERPILPEKPDNAGGGKGPWFKSNARRSKGKEIGVSLITPERVWQLQEALHAKALVCERMNPLERKPDARNGHVRFEERGVETKRMAGYSDTGNRKGRTQLRPAFTPPRHSSTPQTRPVGAPGGHRAYKTNGFPWVFVGRVPSRGVPDEFSKHALSIHKVVVPPYTGLATSGP